MVIKSRQSDRTPSMDRTPVSLSLYLYSRPCSVSLLTPWSAVPSYTHSVLKTSFACNKSLLSLFFKEEEEEVRAEYSFRTFQGGRTSSEITNLLRHVIAVLWITLLRAALKVKTCFIFFSVAYIMRTFVEKFHSGNGDGKKKPWVKVYSCI